MDARPNAYSKVLPLITTNGVLIAANGVLIAANTAALGHKLIDRGDPATYDFAIGDLIVDGAYHPLDLSPIVPVGAVAVKLCVSIVSGNANQSIYFKKNGNTNGINIDAVSIGVAAGNAVHCVTVFCDSDRKIEYYATSGLSTINIAVCGWILEHT